LFASARAIATRCCWTPESWLGRMDALAQPNRFKRSQRAFVPVRGSRARVDQRQLDVGQRVGTGQQIEVLKDEADAPVANFCEAVVIEPTHILTCKLVDTGRRLVQATDHVHQGRLARP